MKRLCQYNYIFTFYSVIIIIIIIIIIIEFLYFVFSDILDKMIAL